MVFLFISIFNRFNMYITNKLVNLNGRKKEKNKFEMSQDKRNIIHNKCKT